MEIVASASGDQRNLRAGGPALVGIVVGSGYAEFLYGILRDGQYRGERVAFRIGVHVHTVQRDVALIAACTVHRAAARIVILVNVRTISGIRDTCLQREKFWNVAGFKRQFPHLAFAEGLAERSVRSVQCLRLRRNFYRLNVRPYLQRDIRGARCTDLQLNLVLLVFAESGLFNRQRVDSGSDGKEFVLASTPRFTFPIEPLSRVYKVNRCSSYGGT